MGILVLTFVACAGLVAIYALIEMIFVFTYLFKNENIRKALNEYAFRSKRYRFEEFMLIYWGISIFYIAIGVIPFLLSLTGIVFFNYMLIVLLFMMLTSYSLGLAFMSMPKIVARIMGYKIYKSIHSEE